MKWITRAHVKVDRVACPWLVSRFIDSEAGFIFVAKSQVKSIAEETGAIPFDVESAELGHHGDHCTFEAFIEKYQLKDPALLRLAAIVRAADLSGEVTKDEIAAGLEAAAAGFSLRYPDDHTNLEIQFEVYDALYAWCKLQTVENK